MFLTLIFLITRKDGKQLLFFSLLILTGGGLRGVGGREGEIERKKIARICVGAGEETGGER